MVKKTGLGKGIAALLPVVEEEGKSYFSCPIEDIRPNREQPRKSFSDDKLAELAASVREKGIIQPLVVRPKDGKYELIAGERRWRAAQKAGLREVPVVIQNVSEDIALEMALIENIQREDLNAVEEAQAYHELMEKFQLSQEELSRRVGKERSTVANALRLLRLPEVIKTDIIEERLTMGHARALLSLHDEEKLKEAREEILKRHLSVRQTENLVKKLREERPPKPEKPTDHDMAHLVEQLKRRFATRVDIRVQGKKGRIEISFNDLDDLTRIVDLLQS